MWKASTTGLLLCGLVEGISAFSISPIPGLRTRKISAKGVAMCLPSRVPEERKGPDVERRSVVAALGLTVPLTLFSAPFSADAKGKGGGDGSWAKHDGTFTPAELEGFTTTETGLQFKIVQEGTGVKPSFNTKVKANYAGYLLANGNKFDASYDRGKPFGFRVGAGQVIKGWDLAFADMKVGEKRIIICPPELAYGNKAVGGGLIPAKSTLVFYVELVTLAT